MNYCEVCDAELVESCPNCTIVHSNLSTACLALQDQIKTLKKRTRQKLRLVKAQCDVDVAAWKAKERQWFHMACQEMHRHTGKYPKDTGMDREQVIEWARQAIARGALL